MTDHRDEKKVDCRECNQNEEGGEIQKWSYVDVNSHVLDCFSRYAAKWKHYKDGLLCCVRQHNGGGLKTQQNDGRKLFSSHSFGNLCLISHSVYVEFDTALPCFLCGPQGKSGGTVFLVLCIKHGLPFRVPCLPLF